MLIKIGNFELEVRQYGLFLGVNLGRRWRYQLFRSWTETWLSASDWIDRSANRVAFEAGRRGN
ncbi:hypothetical protein ABIA20_005596 [Sinorhizobium fredii]